MLIIGAKGFAKEILQVLIINNYPDPIVFYDDLSLGLSSIIYGKYQVLKSLTEASEFFNENSNKFTLGLGNPELRFNLYQKFLSIGGGFTSTISSQANIGTIDVNIGSGCNFLSGTQVSNGVNIGMGTMAYYNVVITHDCTVGKFVELSPGATLLGNVHVGDFTHIGANATILPNLTIGKNCRIGAGAVVTKNVKDHEVVVGIPAKRLDK